MRFHFDLTDGRTTMADADGAEAAGPSDALDQAMAVMEEMRRAGELTDVEDDWHLVVRAADGRELSRIPVCRSEPDPVAAAAGTGVDVRTTWAKSTWAKSTWAKSTWAESTWAESTWAESIWS